MMRNQKYRHAEPNSVTAAEVSRTNQNQGCIKSFVPRCSPTSAFPTDGLNFVLIRNYEADYSHLTPLVIRELAIALSIGADVLVFDEVRGPRGSGCTRGS